MPSPGVDRNALILAAASAELRSEHPLGRTIVAYAVAHGCTPAEPQRVGYTPGRGIHAELDGEVILVGNLALMEESGVNVDRDLIPNEAAASNV